MNTWRVILGDCIERLRELPAESVQCCVTSPPYWGLRDYGVEGQIGIEASPEEWTEKMVKVFREVRRVLREDGTLWLNLGDAYAAGWRGGGGSFMAQRAPRAWHDKKDATGFRPAPLGLKPKDLLGIPWRAAFALQADGWWLRSDIIWHKPNPMPESVTDRPTKSHEYLFLLAKAESYFYDAHAVSEHSKSFGRQKGTRASRIHALGSRWTSLPDDKYEREIRNRRTVWSVATKAFKGAHFATFPEKLVEPCVKAGSKPGDTILDPFSGAGTTGVVALKLGRNYIGIELNPVYVQMSRERLANVSPLLSSEVAA